MLNDAAPPAPGAAPPAPLWRPSEDRLRRARIADYQAWLSRSFRLRLTSYDDLWAWSVREPDAFWRSIWAYFDVRGQAGDGPALAERRMPGARWFREAHLNYVDQVFRHATDVRPAVVAGDEHGALRETSWAELARQVGALARTLRDAGVERGDRVVACLPNRVEAIVAFLATASLGAVWSLCSPDMGVASVVDRFRQIEPKALIASDGYRFAGKVHDRREVVAALREALPSVRVFIAVPYPEVAPSVHDGAMAWADAVAGATPPQVDSVPFDHPLWIVYSSGTTGAPKAIVHGHGGIVLEHLKLAALHNDIGAQDRFHWYSSTGWIMWNCQVSALLAGATVCLLDGSPGWPGPDALWNFAHAVGATFVGAGAAYHVACMKAGVSPRAGGRLPQLRTIGSTGSPLPTQAYEWLQRECGPDTWIAPISGGTDIASAFVAGNCTLPVYAGEMQCRCLGASVHAWSERGEAVETGQVGELVCTEPMPSMPLRFWNDDGDRRLIESYFDMFPGVWRHGDWIEFTPRGGAIIYGRSDATINRHGIRMGTGELYGAVEALPEVADSLVVDLEYLGRESWMALFVVLREGATLDDALVARLIGAIRVALSPKHVPDAVFAVPEVPRTLTGKKLEVPIKRLLLGEPLQRVVQRDAMANPDSLGWFERFAASRRG